MEKEPKVENLNGISRIEVPRHRLARRARKEAVALLPRNTSEMADWMRERGCGKITRKQQAPQIVDVETNMKRNILKQGVTVMKVKVIPDYLSEEVDD